MLIILYSNRVQKGKTHIFVVRFHLDFGHTSDFSVESNLHRHKDLVFLNVVPSQKQRVVFIANVHLIRVFLHLQVKVLLQVFYCNVKSLMF